MDPVIPPKTLLVDARNWAEVKDSLSQKMLTYKMVGLDIETHDADRHEGLNRAMKVNEDGKKSASKKLLFDSNRTTVTGLSLYFDQDPDNIAYYLNLAHADVQNRLRWPEVLEVLHLKPKGVFWIIHNINFERVMLMKSLGFNIGEEALCSMQLCVSAYNDDSYPMHKFTERGLGGIEKLFPAVHKVFAGWEPGQELLKEQEELLMKVIGKESTSEHSYNGYVRTIRYGYGLKEAVKSWFGYQMSTFEETLGDNAHMGQLTGEQVAEYGAEDAFWCVKLFHRVLAYIMQTNPPVFQTYLTQEMPVLQDFAEAWQHGVRLKVDAIYKRRDLERETFAQTLREMKAHIRALLPFDPLPHEKLEKYESWYQKNGESYRAKIKAWAMSPDSDDDFTQSAQVRSPVCVAWAEELGKPEPKGLNLTHYMPMRVILYDLVGCSFMLQMGKVQSDADARATMYERLIKKFDKENPGVVQADPDKKDFGKPLEHRELPPKLIAQLGVMDCYKKIAGIDQRMKLYLNPYLNLVDPDTGRVYPKMSSLLNTRRTSCEDPNGQQLAKQGESTYVRGFFEADTDDEVLISADWSAVELVSLAEYSHDPEFMKAYGSRPHRDMHSVAAAGVMGITIEEFKEHPDKKALRRDVGKGSNFGYWYSGGLGTVAKQMGWSSDQHWEYVEKYRETFKVAEQWRQDTIQRARENGYVELPDHHRRDRFEATYQWGNMMREKFASYGLDSVKKFGELVIKKIQTRSGNQCVNAMIQGICAALAKRKIIAMRKMIQEKGYRARFWLLVHDELVYSVHKDDALDFMRDFYEIMIEGAGIFKTALLDSSMAVGRNFEPFHPEKNPYGQIELMEMNKGLPCIPEDRYEERATEQERATILKYLFERKENE